MHICSYLLDCILGINDILMVGYVYPLLMSTLSISIYTTFPCILKKKEMFCVCRYGKGASRHQILAMSHVNSNSNIQCREIGQDIFAALKLKLGVLHVSSKSCVPYMLEFLVASSIYKFTCTFVNCRSTTTVRSILMWRGLNWTLNFFAICYQLQ
jgi:hypothetical protein